MSDKGEHLLFDSLIDVEYLEEYILAGLPSDVIPSDDLRPIYEYALRYYEKSGSKSAPTVEVFKNTELEGDGKSGKKMADVLEEHEIFLDGVPEETAAWIIEDLSAGYVQRCANEWAKAAIPDIFQAAPADKVRVLAERATELVEIAHSLSSRRTHVELTAVADDILNDYEDRAANSDFFTGMSLGFDEIDEHTNGIHPGELCILGAGPKTGKSFALAWAALQEFNNGRGVALFTLENSIEMTMDRLACMATGVNPRNFQKGECSPAEIEEVRGWIDNHLKPSDSKLHIFSPEQGQRSVENLVMLAQTHGVDSLIIDQLTFIEAPNSKISRHLQIRDITHSLKTLISTGKQRLPCLLAHQISRDGMKNARKNGYHIMEDLAEGSEVERTADVAAALYQSRDAHQVNQVLFQLLAARRIDVKAWQLDWDVEVGHFAVIGETDLRE